MSQRTIEPLRYNFDEVFVGPLQSARASVEKLAPRLTEARREVLADVRLWHSGEKVPAEKQPLDAGFLDLPERLLDEYARDRGMSELGRILATARRIREEVDRVVLLGIGGSYMGARALFEACCHPYHNELPRGERGGSPRLYFAGNNVDNDALQGLLDLLGSRSPARDVLDRWATVVISKSGGTLETAAAFRIVLRALERSCGGDAAQLSELVVPVTGASGRLFELARELGCPQVFDIPDGVGGRFSIFTAVGLLPAAILGLDVVTLLRGAAAMNERFRTAEPGNNPVLDYVGVCHELEKHHGASIRVLSAWSDELEAVGLWYDQLLSESLGKNAQGATPITVVNTRDLHSRGQQHQEGRRDKVITNLIVDHPRRDPLVVGRSDRDQDHLNALADKSIPEILDAAIRGTNQAYADDGRPTADLHLPRLDEGSLGQLFQMFMLATVLEGRLVGTNPYGQPGVEHYKRNMNAFLRGA